MRKYIIILILIISSIFAKSSTNDLQIYSKYTDNKIVLKWKSKNYSSKNSYKIYKKISDQKEKLIAIVKPLSYEKLKKAGYSEDYIFMLYPFKDVKDEKDRIKVLQIQNKLDVFRVLQMAQDNQFARNIGQLYEDKNVEKAKTYIYKIEQYRDKKLLAKRLIKVETKSQKPKNSILWIQLKILDKGIGLNWDISKNYGFFNIYKKYDGKKEFVKLNEAPMYIDANYANKKEYLFRDSDIKVGQSARYYVRKIDMFGEEGKASYTVTAKIEKVKRRGIVKNIFVKNSENKIALRWSKEKDAMGYNVYRSKVYEGGFKKINKKLVKKEAYFDRDFMVGQNYYYYVTAVNLKGESPASSKMLAYTRDNTPPAFPKKLTSKVTVGEIKLAWDDVKENDLLGYKVYMAMKKDAKQWALINKEPIKTSSFVHKRAKTLSRNFYYYKVTAVDKGFNESAFSNILKVKLPDVIPPEQPVVIKFHAYPDKILIEWNEIIVYDFSYYNVYKKIDNKFIKLNKKELIRRIFTDKDMKNTANEYVITAVDKSGNESKKVKSQKINAVDIVAPTIKNFSVKLIGNGAKISFTCTDKDYNGFEVYKSIGETRRYTNISGFSKGKSFTDKSVLKNMTYFYMIKAYDKTGNIKESKVIRIKLEK